MNRDRKSKVRVEGIIQARMGSTRLPGKCLLPIAGKPALQVLLDRLRLSRLVVRWVIATTDLERDNVIADFARTYGVACFRGAENDVLDRYYQAALEFPAEVIVRVTSDCPLLEGGVVDAAVEDFLSGGCDLVETSLDHTYPLGLSTEVFSFATLEKLWREDKDPATREHVTARAYKDPRYKLRSLGTSGHYGHMRWTVDEPADLDLVRRIYDAIGKPIFPWHDALAIVEQHPEWLEINRHVKQKAV